MSSTIHLDIVSAEHEIFSGEAEIVFAPALLGEMGIAPGHTPLVTQLAPGEVRVKHPDGKEEGFYVSGGLLEIQPKVITVLSDTAMRAEDLDEASVLKAKEEAERKAKEEAECKATAAAAAAKKAPKAKSPTKKKGRKRG